jgi:hypothetical protein
MASFFVFGAASTAAVVAHAAVKRGRLFATFAGVFMGVHTLAATAFASVLSSWPLQVAFGVDSVRHRVPPACGFIAQARGRALPERIPSSPIGPERVPASLFCPERLLLLAALRSRYSTPCARSRLKSLAQYIERATGPLRSGSCGISVAFSPAFEQ